MAATFGSTGRMRPGSSLYAWSCPDRCAATTNPKGLRGAPLERELAVADSRPWPIAKQRSGRLDNPTGEVKGLAEATAVEDKPLAAVAACVEAHQWSREQVQRTAHRVEQDQATSAYPPHRFQSPQRVTQHLQHVTHHHEVELADFGRIEVVDAQVAQLGPRPEQFGGKLKVSLRGAAVPLAAHPVRGEVVEPGRVENVDGHHLAGPTALELKRPEPVHRPDVETTQPSQRRRPRQPQGRPADSQPPGVRTPGATSIVCHQSSPATRTRTSSASSTTPPSSNWHPPAEKGLARTPLLRRAGATMDHGPPGTLQHSRGTTGLGRSPP